MKLAMGQYCFKYLKKIIKLFRYTNKEMLIFRCCSLSNNIQIKDSVICKRYEKSMILDDDVSFSIARKSNDDDEIYVVINNNKVVAHAMVSTGKVWTSEIMRNISFSGEPYVYNIYVSRMFRGNGYQQALMNKIGMIYPSYFIMSESKNIISKCNIERLGGFYISNISYRRFLCLERLEVSHECSNIIVER
ncbi:GNAT family N-acetyltransferase [Edwardsiella tarda]|uniref:GNAT family N-acetyltransferase n=1 Tax=Edwardsiella tarda TaxID=636 RepID=UPI0011874DB3|nr:GNAT family N-acetyltransferase [Edwardsiella tarda]UBU95212.1 GNAT family N-acetyltransferase [Edwardsiella tarda]